MNNKQIELKKLKDKFSEFISVGNDIKRLHGMHCTANKRAPSDTEGFRVKHIEFAKTFSDEKTKVSNVMAVATVGISGTAPKITPNATVVKLGPADSSENCLAYSQPDKRPTIPNNFFDGRIESANIAIGSTVESRRMVSMPEVTLNATCNEYNPPNSLDYYFSANGTVPLPQVTRNATVVELGPPNSLENCLGYSQPDKRPTVPNNFIDGQIESANIAIGSTVESRGTVPLPQVTRNATVVELGPPNSLENCLAYSQPDKRPTIPNNFFDGRIESANIAIGSTVESRRMVSMPEVTLNATCNEYNPPNSLDFYFSANGTVPLPQVTRNATVVELGPPNSWENCLGYSQPDKRPTVPNNFIDGQIESANIAIGSTVESRRTVSMPEVTLNATCNEYNPPNSLDYYFSANGTVPLPQVTRNATVVELGPPNSLENCLGYSQPDKRPTVPNNLVSMPEVTPNTTSNDYNPPNALDCCFSANGTATTTNVAMSNSYLQSGIVAGCESDNIVFDANLIDAIVSFNTFGNALPDVTKNATVVNLNSCTSNPSHFGEGNYTESIDFTRDFLYSNYEQIVALNDRTNMLPTVRINSTVDESRKNIEAHSVARANNFAEESNFIFENPEHSVNQPEIGNNIGQHAIDSNIVTETFNFSCDSLHDYEIDIDVDVTTVPINTSSNLATSNSIAKADCDVMECGTIDIERNRGCDSSKMFVPTSNSGPKKYCCMYCKVRVQKLERHLRTRHKNEKDVKKYLAFPLRSAQRRRIILRILKQGDAIWNSDEQLNEGEYAVRRRPNKKFKRKPWDLIWCPACLGAYSKSYLTRHWNKECAKNPLIGERVVHQLGRAVEGRLYKDASKDLVDLFATFRENQNIRYIRFDWLVICYGNELCMNNSPHYQQGYICGKLRAAAKVLCTSKSIASEISDMASLFHVKHCNTVVDAIRTMGKFDGHTKLFGSPGTASTTVTLINSIGDLLITEYMKLDDPEKERDVERFLKVFKRDVKSKITKLAAVSTLDKKRQKEDEDIIPTTADVLRFAKYLDSEREICFSRLVQKYSYDDWLKLSNLTLVSILVYNRRRAGEMQNILLSDFERRKMIAELPDTILSQITEAAQRNIKSRLNVRNKLGKKLVPVLLKHNWDDSLALLVRHRTDAGIGENNKFLFALPTQSKRIKTENACSLMQSLSVLCGAENPKSLRGTLLRKHMATFSSTKNLSDSDISFLADFMGHAEAVHRTYYRVNTIANQVGKISVLLDSALGNENSKASGNGTADGNGKGGGDGSEDDNGDDSEVDSDECYEFENDSETEAVAAVKPARRTAKKQGNTKKKPNIKPKKANVKSKKVNLKPKKMNVKPNKVPKSRKMTVETIEVKNKKNNTKRGKTINREREVK